MVLIRKFSRVVCSLFAALLLSGPDADANIIISIYEDSATRLHFSLDWSDPEQIEPVVAIGEGGSYIDAWTAGRAYGWEVIAHVNPIGLGLILPFAENVASWPINFSNELINLDPSVPRDMSDDFGLPAFCSFDSDLKGAHYVIGEQLTPGPTAVPVPDDGSTATLLILAALLLGASFGYRRA